jgi:hypothetical protein
MPGHAVVEHSSIALICPEQCNPAFEGDGLSHILDRVIVPLPHVTGHEFQPSHAPQFPYTTKTIGMIN